MLAVIQQNPGATLRGVCRLTGLSMGTVSHHEARLRGSGAVTCYTTGRVRHYFAGHVGPDEAQRILETQDAQQRAQHLSLAFQDRILGLVACGHDTAWSLNQAVPETRQWIEAALRLLVRRGELRVRSNRKGTFYEVA
jgi:hypothetical protein